VLSAAGLGVMVLGVLQASNWGWLLPRSSPIEPFGLSLTPFVIAAGGLILAGFRAWEARRERRGEDPLVHLGLLKILRLRSGLAMLLAQNMVLMGIFFTVPLFLQIVLGLDALETGIRMLPASVGLFVTALAGSALANRYPARTLVRAGLGIVLLAVLLLLDTVEPELDNTSFLVAMGVLGIGMGLIVSQLGNVVQSSVEDRDRSEAGGLQNTAQQLGSSLGTALLGAIVISGLITAFTANVGDDPRISNDVEQLVNVRVSSGASFVSADQVRSAAESEGLDPGTTERLVSHYEDAQLSALKIAFLGAAMLIVVSFFFTSGLPTKRFDELQAAPRPPPVPAAA
jgi:Na+/melibiose symporter-like transporter